MSFKRFPYFCLSSISLFLLGLWLFPYQRFGTKVYLVKVDEALILDYDHLSWEKNGELYRLSADDSRCFDFLDKDPRVSYYQKIEAPILETNIPAHDLSVNHIDWFKNEYGQTGDGLLIGVKENSPDSLDIDIRGKVVYSSLYGDQFDTHATAMANIIAGRGTNSKQSLGVLPKAFIKPSSFFNVLPDPDPFLSDIPVQNHSYGFDIQNGYDLLANAYDIVSREEETLHVFSSGNFGERTPDHGVYENISGFANLSGGIKQAKNTLIVGATDKEGEVVALSSRGPTYDGRIKPDLVAYGSEGSSESAALVSGSAGLIAQYYEELHINIPSNDLIKSVLIASAKDIANPGPDFISGFGSLDLSRAGSLISNGQFFQGRVMNAQEQAFQVEVPAEVKQLRVALVWNDEAAEAGAENALINDLDLIASQGGAQFLPLVPDPRPGFLSEVATPRRDSLNNVELLIIDSPQQGLMEISVSGYKVSNEGQQFSLSYHFEFNDQFKWLSPHTGTNAQTGEELRLGFLNTFSSVPVVTHSKDGGPWEPISDVSDDHAFFTFPSDGQYQFKASFGVNDFLSEPLDVTSPLLLSKLFECENELLFNWSGDNALTYELQGIDPRTFELTTIRSTNDTASFLNANSDLLTLGYFKVKPILSGQPLASSALYNFNADGIGCFYKRWSAGVDKSEVDLSLELTTDWNVQGVSFYKIFEGDTVPVRQDGQAQSLTFNATSSEKRNAYYQYYSEIILNSPINSSDVIQTDLIEVPIFIEQQNSVFPNPVRSGAELFFLGQDDISRIRLFDQQGDFVATIVISSREEVFTLKGIGSGLYLYQLIDLQDRLVGTGRLIVQ